MKTPKQELSHLTIKLSTSKSRRMYCKRNSSIEPICYYSRVNSTQNIPELKGKARVLIEQKKSMKIQQLPSVEGSVEIETSNEKK